MLWKSCVLSSCDCALEQLFCCTVMNLRVMKISVKLYDRYSICTWASHCGKYIIFNSIAFEIWLWLGNITANSAYYNMDFGTAFLWNPYLSLCSHVQSFYHEQWEHCCFAVKVFSLAKKKKKNKQTNCLKYSKQLWLWLCTQWSNLNLLKGRQLLLSHTTHPSLLHSVIVIGFHPCFMRKEMLQERMMFIMRTEILTVQVWHLHRVIRKGLATWKCKYPIYLDTYFHGVCFEMFSNSQICCSLPAVHMCMTHWHSYICWM